MKIDVQVNFSINGINRKKKWENIGYLLLITNTLAYQNVLLDFLNKSTNWLKLK